MPCFEGMNSSFCGGLAKYYLSFGGGWGFKMQFSLKTTFLTLCVMYIVKCKGKWKDLVEYELYLRSTLIIKNTGLPWDTEIAEKFNCEPRFQIQACSNFNTSLTLEPNA